MEEELGYAPTDYGDFVTSVSFTLENNPNARYTVNVDKNMNVQSLTYNTGIQDYTVGPNRVTTSNGILFVGVSMRVAVTKIRLCIKERNATVLRSTETPL